MNKEEQKNIDNEDLEARENRIGFFDLLLKIDQRINPDLYKNQENLQTT